jgi:hypothetical protein
MSQVDKEMDVMGTYDVHVSPWHASHALMREYEIVLHLHKFPSSTPLGPVYEYPGWRAAMENAVRGKGTRWLVHEGDDSLPPLHVDIKYAATVHAF